jgi:uncharacterized small protein (DUF1192 family)
MHNRKLAVSVDCRYDMKARTLMSVLPSASIIWRRSWIIAISTTATNYPVAYLLNIASFTPLTISTMSSNDLEGEDIWGDVGEAGESKIADAEDETKENEEQLDDDDTRHMSISELRQRIHLLNSDIRVMKSDVQRITHESRGQRDRIKENQEKVKLNKQLPYLVANVVEILEPDAEDGKKSINYYHQEGQEIKD